MSELPDIKINSPMPEVKTPKLPFEYIRVKNGADPFSDLDGIMMVIVRLGIDPQEIIDHVEKFVDDICGQIEVKLR